MTTQPLSNGAKHADWEYHVSTDEGALSLYCSQYGSRTECSTNRGDSWWVTFDDGSRGPCCDISWPDSTWKDQASSRMAGPLLDLTNSLIDSNRVAHSGTFKYRIGQLYQDRSGTFCVPDNRTDKKGRTMVGEACYGTIFIQPPHRREADR
jgi:hypothetical protein